MANTISVHQMLARDGAAMLEDECNFITNINRGRDEDFTSSIHGYKKGDFVDITVPFQPVVFDGATFAAGGSAPDFTETKVRLQLNVQRHTAITVTSVEKALKMESERERIMRPAMQALASEIETYMLQQAYLATPNLVGSYGTVPTASITYSQARAVLEKFRAPTGDRSVVFSSDANIQLVDASKALFHADREISKQYSEGYVGKFGGLMFNECQVLPVHTNGTQGSWTVAGASQTGTSLNISGLTNAQTILKGTTFVIANVQAVHPITGDALGSANLRRFVVTADHTVSGTTGTISIYPGITPSTATLVGTVNASPAASAACTLDGAASAQMRVALAFQKEAYAAAFGKLQLVPGTEGYSARVKGFAVRVMEGGSFTADTRSTRVDVLFGFATVRPDHATRIPS